MIILTYKSFNIYISFLLQKYIYYRSDIYMHKYIVEMLYIYTYIHIYSGNARKCKEQEEKFKLHIIKSPRNQHC